MNTKVKWVLSAIVVVVLIIALWGWLSPERDVYPEQARIGICLILEGETFQVDEDIRCSIVFKNFSEHGVYLNKGFNIRANETTLAFEILRSDSTAPVATFPILTRLLEKRHFVWLNGGGLSETKRRLNWWYRLDEPGKYRVRVRYANANDGAEFHCPAWTGIVVSSEATFEIIEPDGNGSR